MTILFCIFLEYMTMNWDKNLIGEKAGIVWRVLNCNEMSWDELLKIQDSPLWNWQVLLVGLRGKIRLTCILAEMWSILVFIMKVISEKIK